MDVEVYISDAPIIKGSPEHKGKHLIVKLPSIVKGGKFFYVDKNKKLISMVNFGVSYYVEDVDENFELGEESLRKVNDIVNNYYPDEILKQVKIINKTE